MTWRAIPGFPRYEIHPLGCVRRARNQRPLKVSLRAGYHRVQLTDSEGRRRWRPLHQLVLETFVGPRPSPRHEGAHIDGRKSNNALDSLAWKTPEQNTADKRTHGTASKPGVKPTRLEPLDIEEIRARVLELGEPYSRVARDFGLHRHSVSRIARGLRHAQGVSPS